MELVDAKVWLLGVIGGLGWVSLLLFGLLVENCVPEEGRRDRRTTETLWPQRLSY